jgi:DUF1680 family protein
VRLAEGPWRDLHDRVATVTVPAMSAQLHDPAIGHAYENFRIAAGDTTGEHAGPPFMDGDMYKWLEAAAALQTFGHDEDRAAWIAEAADVIGRAQRADGYVHTQTLIANRARGDDQPLEDRLNFETYNLGHLMTAGVILKRATGDDALLDLGRRAADYIDHLWRDRTDLLARSAICPAHYMGVVELYRETRDERYLDLAKALLDIRDRVATSGLGGDDNQDRAPLRDQTVIAGHAVRSTYLYAGAADVVAETGDADLLRVLEGLWADLVGTKLYLTGGCGALYDGASPDGNPEQSVITRVHQAFGRAYQLPNTTAHNETCASIGLVLWGWRMLTLTGESHYADTIEQVLLNALPASIGLDGASYFYTNPLRQVAGLPYALRRPGDTAIRPVPTPPPSNVRLRQEWLSCFCCPPNIARLLAELPYLLHSVTPKGLAIHQYVSSDVQVEVDGRPLAVTVRSDLHGAQGTGRVTITVQSAVRAELRIRVPGWAEKSRISVGGRTIQDRDRGYAVIERVLVPRTCRWTPYEKNVVGTTVTALRGTCLVSPEADPGLYADLPTGAPEQVEVTLIPYAVWANRGPSEMSVWLRLAW